MAAVIKDSIPEQPTRKEVYRDQKEKKRAEERKKLLTAEEIKGRMVTVK